MHESVTDRPTNAHEHIFLLAKCARYFYDADAIREPHSEVSLARAHRNRFGGKYDGADPVEHGALKRGNGYGPGGDPDLICSPGGRNKRNVWEIATHPYAEAHFATFPAKLVEPCVLAGSSPKACGECGAPWRRITETERRTYDARARTTPARATGAAHDNYDAMDRNMAVVVKTIGWEPSCDHDDDSGRCVVLDPFAGSGTVGVVCAWHARDFLGLELNPQYAEMARRRIATEGRLGRSAYRPEPPADGQLALLEDAP
jgi:hypothetical protein